MAKSGKTVYTVAEAAEKLNFSTKTIRKYITEKKLVAFRPGKSYRITKSAISRFENNLNAKERRKVESDIKLMETSHQNIWILGINALSPLHRGFEAIKQRMRCGVNIRVLLLNPMSSAFKERANREADGTPECSVLRLKAEYNASIAICRCIADSVSLWAEKNRCNCGKIEVRLHSEPPHGSMIIADYLSDGDAYWVCNYNPYPISRKTRGISGRTLFYDNNLQHPYADSEYVERYKNEYENLFASSEIIDIYGFVDETT